MPNWCENNIVITGNKKSIQKLAEAKLSLDKLLPIPEELQYPKDYYVDELVRVEFEKKKKDNLKKYGNSDWYDWCINNWGTKWDIDLIKIDSSETEIVAQFQTAWSPPITAMYKLVQKYPDLEIDLKYFEGGVGFVGRAYLTDTVFDDNCVNYSSIQEFKDAISDLGVHEFEEEIELMEEQE